MSLFSMPTFGIGLIIEIALCVHVVRTNQPLYWLFLILVVQPIGAAIYFFAIVLPELTGGNTARRVGRVARDSLDPHRDYRVAKAACDDLPTVQNQMHLAKAAAGLGRFGEAEALYRAAAQGIHAEDPILLLGRATALLELNRASEAMPLLEALGQDEKEARTPYVTLAVARAHEALGRVREADEAYQRAVGRLPGLEGLGRYAAFLARHGRADDARESIAEMDRRIAKANPQFRKEGRAWRDLAARALS